MGFVGELIGILQHEIPHKMLGDQIAKGDQQAGLGREAIGGNRQEKFWRGHKLVCIF